MSSSWVPGYGGREHGSSEGGRCERRSDGGTRGCAGSTRGGRPGGLLAAVRPTTRRAVPRRWIDANVPGPVGVHAAGSFTATLKYGCATAEDDIVVGAAPLTKARV